MRKAVRCLVFILATFIAVPAAFAHCDSLKGPVIADARLAFKQGQVTPVLKWVKQSDEAGIRDAFARAMAVRSQGQQARELAEQYFFETLVRLHRASEGAPYTGLKDQSSDAVIASVDDALQVQRGEDLTEQTLQHVRAELKARFDRAVAARKTADSSVEAGRDYVRAYVDLVHFVEHLHTGTAEAVQTEAHQHE